LAVRFGDREHVTDRGAQVEAAAQGVERRPVVPLGPVAFRQGIEASRHPLAVVERFPDRERLLRQLQPLAVITQRSIDPPDVVDYRRAAAAVSHAFELVEAALEIVERGGVVPHGAIGRADVVQGHGRSLVVADRLPQGEAAQVERARVLVAAGLGAQVAELARRFRHAVAVVQRLGDVQALGQRLFRAIRLPERPQRQAEPGKRDRPRGAVVARRRHVERSLEQRLGAPVVPLVRQQIRAIGQAFRVLSGRTQIGQRIVREGCAVGLGRAGAGRRKTGDCEQREPICPDFDPHSD
jgi:hypothetical protein